MGKTDGRDCTGVVKMSKNKNERAFIIDENRNLELERGYYVRSDLKRDIERAEERTGKKVMGIVYDGSFTIELLLEDVKEEIEGIA